jgi:magnesium-protoporphyrin IX monomethyl ester (oxidative) cyclase
MERLRLASVAGAAAAARGGIGGRLAQAGWAIAGAAAFVGLYFLPVKQNDAPAQVRLSPAW